MVYNRSQKLKDRWAESREYHEYYKSQNPNSKYGVKTFFKKDNPLSQKIHAFDVSYQLSYRDKTGSGIQINKQTFKVYTIEFNPETKGSIKDTVANSIIEMRANQSGDSWSRNAKENLIKPNLQIDVDRLSEPRGIEESRETLSREVINKVIANSGYYAKDLDTQVNLKKIKHNKTVGNYTQDLDLTGFM